ncbi:cytochrome c peroxidase [Chryseobacterium sp. MYb328]
MPIEYGVELGEKLFQDKRLSVDNTIVCSGFHIQGNAFANTNVQRLFIIK